MDLTFHRMSRTGLAACVLIALALGGLLPPSARAADDAYAKYVKTSRDFAPVRQDKAWATKAWPSWTYVPWTYRWTISYDDAAGKWSTENGYNGAFLDHGQTVVGGIDKLAWINRFKLPFYVDHTASKGYWTKAGRSILFVCFNPELTGSSLGGGNSVGLKSDAITIRLVFNRPVTNVRNERAKTGLPEGKEHELIWTMNEAVVLSFAGPPPK